MPGTISPGIATLGRMALLVDLKAPDQGRHHHRALPRDQTNETAARAQFGHADRCGLELLPVFSGVG
jgi:hypothetical protein